MPMPNSSLERRVELYKTVGVAVLVLGLITSSILYWGGEQIFLSSSHERESDPGGSWKDGSLSPEDAKGSSRTIEMNYGKIAVLVTGWLHRWMELKPHQWLAILIATVTTLIAIGCFMIAHRLQRAQI
jgi:hypothetical protein